jgi:hypothetical protein
MPGVGGTRLKSSILRRILCSLLQKNCSSGQTVHKTLSGKTPYTHKKKLRLVEWLKVKALSSTPVLQKKKKKRLIVIHFISSDKLAIAKDINGLNILIIAVDLLHISACVPTLPP